MAAENPLTSLVRNFYNKINKDLSVVARCNDEDLTDPQKEIFASLGEEIKKRYYGSGLNIPENVKGKRILDIGCGSGSFVFILSKLVGPTGYVVGFDLSDGLIQTARDNSEFHQKAWGYEKANFEFHVLNAEHLGECGLFKPEEFDTIVSNGVFCLIPEKEKTFKAAYNLLKPGGQFYLNDVYADKLAPEEQRDNVTLWSMGTTGAMKWDTLAPMMQKVGFTTPHLSSVGPIFVSEKYQQMLGHARYLSAGWRLFKLDSSQGKAKTVQGPSFVTYNGGIGDYPDCFPWDVNLAFKKGEGVEVDAELASLLSSCYLSHCFSFQPASGKPVTKRNQNPFELMDKLQAEGKLPDIIYKIE